MGNGSIWFGIWSKYGLTGYVNSTAFVQG